MIKNDTKMNNTAEISEAPHVLRIFVGDVWQRRLDGVKMVVTEPEDYLGRFVLESLLDETDMQLWTAEELVLLADEVPLDAEAEYSVHFRTGGRGGNIDGTFRVRAATLPEALGAVREALDSLGADIYLVTEL
jgi:hypothetical protein